MQLMHRVRDEHGSALITALLATTIMLALGMALLTLVDTQASQSGIERTRDRGFNLSESVLTSEAFVLGRNWPESAPPPAPPPADPDPDCSEGDAGFSDTVGATTTPSTATARLRSNINASYTDTAYTGATWQVNVCDDDAGTEAWSDTLTANKTWDVNDNKKVWVRAQSTVGGKTRAVVGLVKVRELPALKSKYGLVAGNLSEDLSAATSAITNAPLVTAVTSSLLNTGSGPVAPDPAHAVPASGVTGLRCGLLDNVLQVKTCVTGAIGALSQVPLVNTLVTQGRFEQFPSISSTSPNTIGQLRKQSKTAPGVYMATAPGATSAASAPSCAVTAASSSDTVIFIEQVGTGDQYCVLDVSTSRTYKALVIGSGRVIIRGNNTIGAYAAGAANNLLTGVVYALNLQTTNQAAATPIRELVRIERGARVRGAVHADGKNATVGIVVPDFDPNALINGLLCPGALCVLVPTVTGLLTSLGLSGTIDALINGACVGVKLGAVCLGVTIPALGLNTVVSGITAQLTTYGAAIRSDVAVVNNLTVYGASGVVPGTFRDLQSK